MPPERDLAQQLGVSRNVLREALRSLEMAGVLRLQKGVKGGAFIQEGDTGRMNDVMRDMLSLGAISGARAVRGANSCSRSRRPPGLRECAASRFSGAGSKYRADGTCDARGPIARSGRMSREFYKLLAAATGNKVIAMIMDSVTEIHMRFVYAKVASSGAAMPRLVEKRRQFLSALCAAGRLGGYAPDANSSGIGSADAGGGSGFHVASCRFGGHASGRAPIGACAHLATNRQ